MLKNLSDFELHEQRMIAAADEKNATLRLLEFLREMKIRKAYVARGYRNLFDYFHRGLGFSESATAERIRAVDLLQNVPEAKTAIETGELTLTSAAQIGRVIYHQGKTTEEVRELFSACAGKSTREIEKILLPEASTPAPERVKPVSKTTTEIRLEVDEEFMQLLKRAQELPGDLKISDVIRRTLLTYVKKKSPPTRAPEQTATASNGSHRTPKNRHIPAPVRHAVRTTSGDQCEFVDPTTHSRCASRTHLQMHHCEPYACGGAHTAENLRHLCPVHHAYVEGRLTARNA